MKKAVPLTERGFPPGMNNFGLTDFLNHDSAALGLCNKGYPDEKRIIHSMQTYLEVVTRDKR